MPIYAFCLYVLYKKGAFKSKNIIWVYLIFLSDIQIAHKKERIKEHKQKQFFLENKIRLLEDDVKRAEEIFSQNKILEQSSKAEEVRQFFIIVLRF